MAVAQDYANDPATATFAVIHSTLRRQGYDLPDLDTFIDQLDALDAIKEEGMVDPIRPVDSGKGPLPYR
jgi:hypothetical protein